MENKDIIKTTQENWQHVNSENLNTSIGYHYSVYTLDNDTPGHDYEIHHRKNTETGRQENVQTIKFQNGPLLSNPVNGLTNESLLEVLIHRTTILNNNFPCKENEEAIQHMTNALNALRERTRNRQQRGAEGKNEI